MNNVKEILSVKESEKNLEWYKKVVRKFLPANNSYFPNYYKRLLPYQLLNNNLEGYKEELDRFCNPAKDLFESDFNIDETVIAYNRIHSKASYHIGEIIKRSMEFEPILTSNRLNEYADQKYIEKVMESVDQSILNSFTGEEDKATEELSKIDKKSFLSDAEEFFAHLTKQLIYNSDFKRQVILGIQHVLCSDKFSIGIVQHHGKPFPMVFNSLYFGVDKSPDEYRYEKGDYFYYRTPITLNDLIDEVGNSLTEEEMNTLVSTTGSNPWQANEKWDVLKGAKLDHGHKGWHELKNTIGDRGSKNIGQAMDSDLKFHENHEDYIWKTYIQFKAYRELLFRMYINELGEEVWDILDSNYEMPKNKQKIKKDRYGYEVDEWLWIEDEVEYKAFKLKIPRRYEVTIYGDKIYKNYRECPYQTINLEDPIGSFELSIKGETFSGLNAEPISPIERATNSYFQYLLLKQLQNKELIKYEGSIRSIDVDQIPNELGLDDNGEYDQMDAIAKQRYIRKTFGDSYYSGSQNNEGLPTNYQKTDSLKGIYGGGLQDLAFIGQLLEIVDREIGMQMLVPPQAEGIYEANSNVSDNQQAIAQGFTMAEPYYVIYENILQRCVGEYLKQMTEYYKEMFESNPGLKESSFTYVTPDGVKEVIKVLPEYLDFEDLGIFMYNSSENDYYRRFMEQSMHAFGQRGGDGMEEISTVLVALARKKSPETIHKMIVSIQDKQNKRLEETENRKNQLQLQLVEEQNKQQEIAHERQKELLIIEKEYDKDIQMLREMEGTDKDDVPAPLEAEKIQRELQIKEREQNRKEMETNKKLQESTKKP